MDTELGRLVKNCNKGGGGALHLEIDNPSNEPELHGLCFNWMGNTQIFHAYGGGVGGSISHSSHKVPTLHTNY